MRLQKLVCIGIYAGLDAVRTAWGAYAVGEKQNRQFQPSCSASLKVDLQGSGVTSDVGLVLARELDDRLGLSEPIEQHLTESRGMNTRWSSTWGSCSPGSDSS